MKIENIQSAIRLRPFKPFLLHTGSGESHRVRHPEMIAVSPVTSVLLMITGPGETAMVDVESITEITDDFNARKATVEG